MHTQGGLSIERMCQLAGVSRAGFYRDWQQREAKAEETDLRAQVQQIALAQQRRYGYRRITAELKRQGRVVNHKRVARLMQADNLLALRGRKCIVTTAANHDLQVYWNLAARLRLSAINQLWMAEITYIRLRQEMVYLAVVLDAFSRRVVGWAVDDTLQTRLPLAALQMAIAARQPAPGLVHHSDRGVQYASNQYVALLGEHGITPSMSRAGNPYDNAYCESFMKTLKQEEMYTREYRDRADLEARIDEFLGQYYNRQRLHSALGYRPPEEFERSLEADRGQLPATLQLSFLRHEGNYRPMVDSHQSPEGAANLALLPAGATSLR